MGKEREMSDDEKNFIEDTLRSHNNLEVEENEKDDSHVKIVDTKKKKRTPGYKNPTHWLIAFSSLPILAIAAFFIMLMRAEQYLGGRGTIDYLVENNHGVQGEMIKKVAQEAGQEWLPTFLLVYEYRITIVSVLIALFLIIVITFVLIDAKRHKKKTQSEENKENDKNSEDGLND